MALALALILLASGVGFCVVRSRRNADPAPDLDPKAAAKAAIELHRIRRNLDVAMTRSEIRRDAARLRREAKEALDEYRP
jgi:hypothetical protein